MTTEPRFVKDYRLSKTKAKTKDILLIDQDDKPAYGIAANPDRKWYKAGSNFARIVKYDADGSAKLLGEVDWKGDHRDLFRWPGGSWQLLYKAWHHHDATVDKYFFVDQFEGETGQKYMWWLDGSTKVLSKEDKSGSVIARHRDEGETGGLLQMTRECEEVGDMMFVTFLTSEGLRNRSRWVFWNFFWAMPSGGVGVF